jgi:hypothetical protein
MTLVLQPQDGRDRYGRILINTVALHNFPVYRYNMYLMHLYSKTYRDARTGME